MLNDVMSLIVALYAIKLTKNVASAEYSYGWHRAEILAALINGVFLLALCFSIFIEAIERFFSVPEVGSPKLVVIVGSLGLASNIIGLFLFHDHGHDHGPSSPEPLTPPPGTKAFPVGNVSTSSLTPLLPPGSTAPPPRSLSAQPPSISSSSNGKVVITNSPPSHRRSDSIPRRRRSNSNTSISFHPAQVRASLVQVAEEMRAEEQEEQAYMAAASSPKTHSPMKRTFSRHETRSSLDHTAVAEGGDSYSRAEEGRIATTTAAAPGRRNDAVDSDSDDEDAPLDSTLRRPHSHNHSHVHAHDPNHAGHGSSGHGGGGHGHAHGSMNMHAVLLHVIGDALGNVGVIATGLIIWLTEWKWKYYCDPTISLIITCIIFSSALPLVKSASFILLQGVPSSVSLVDVRSAILSIPGVISVHELHIWQLSESKIVASVHVLVRKSLKGCKKTNSNSVPSTPPNGKVNPPPSNSQSEAVSLVVGTDDHHHDDETTDVEGGEHVYMAVASEIRRILHEFGIHSSTIQPEYATDGMDDETRQLQSDRAPTSSRTPSPTRLKMDLAFIFLIYRIFLARLLVLSPPLFLTFLRS
ncbi:hypothetical protein FRC05_002688 [Tulasnella sp. 425]|nr:hypothetical protein FRC05_002688 [Tulasnella sp. 425]